MTCLCKNATDIHFFLEHINSIHKRIDETQHGIDHMKENDFNRNAHYLSQFDRLETEINTVRALGSRAYHTKKPHKCPVCDGSMYVESLGIGSKCHSCEGKGVLWG
jgi:hypothetical protein